MSDVTQADLEAMDARVDANVQKLEAEQTDAPAEAVTPDFVSRCAGFAEKGDGILHSALFKGKLVYVPETKTWYAWQGQHWEATHIHRVEASVEEVGVKYREIAAHYDKLATQFRDAGDKIKADQIAAAAERMGKRSAYNPGEKGKNCIIRPRPVWGLPPEKKEDGKDKFLWLPRGIVIPQVLGDDDKETVHRVRIRRLDTDRDAFRPKHKYHVVEGSSMDVLWLDCTTSMHEGGGVVVVVESELDAVLLHALAGDMAHCVASMTSNIRKLSASVFDRLNNALCILVALDMDKAGADGWTRWQETFRR